MKNFEDETGYVHITHARGSRNGNDECRAGHES